MKTVVFAENEATIFENGKIINGMYFKTIELYLGMMVEINSCFKGSYVFWKHLRKQKILNYGNN